MKTPAFVALMVVAAAGCHDNIYFSDDEAGPRASDSALSDHDDELSLPYALGTTVGITVKRTSGNIAAWQFLSDTPAIFAIDSQKLQDDGTLWAQGHAIAEGAARIRVVDGSGHEQRSAPVMVRAPDRARLFAHGELRVAGDNNAALASSELLSNALVLAGGKAAFAVTYYRGAQRVYGRGIAAVDPVATLTVENQTSTGRPTNEWLFVTPTAPGDTQLVVRQGAATLATLPLTALPESALAGVTLAEEKGASHDDNTQIWVLARASDTTGREVFGVYTDWTLDGAAQVGDGNPPQTSGDLYRYLYASSGATKMLVATRGSVTANLAIHAKDGKVMDTTYLGCSAAPGAAPTRAVGWALCLVGLGLAARRSRRRRPNE